MEEKRKQPQYIRGVVVGDKMNKTRVIEVQRNTRHSFYGKRMLRTEKFFIHDEKNASKVGDSVVAVSSRPLSRHKSFRLVEIVGREGIEA